MKPINFHIPHNDAESLRVQEDIGPRFYDKIHQHPEIQLDLILKGTGTRSLGSQVSNFGPGDLMLIGTRMPHIFRCEGATTPESAHKIMLFFPPDYFGSFLDKPEMAGIKDLLNRSRFGLDIHGKTREQVSQWMRQALILKGIDRILLTLRILKAIAHSEETTTISDLAYDTSRPSENRDRIHRIMEYILANFHSQIRLAQVAELANMVPSAFCRYFKMHTGKTFVRFLNEVRIGHAIRLLVEEDRTISEVAYNCGFNNMSNFHRQFKEIKGMPPIQFLKTYHGKMVS